MRTSFFALGLLLTLGSVLGADTALTYTIRQGADDVAEFLFDGTMVTNEAHLAVGSGAAGAQAIGLRFQGIQISPSMRILEAYLVFTAAVDEANDVPLTVTITGEAVDDAEPFTPGPHNLSARSRTEALASWQDDAMWRAEQTRRTPDLSPILREIVARPGWQRGHDLVLILTGAGPRTALAFEGAVEAEQAPRLVIIFTTWNNFTPGTGTDDAMEVVTSGAVDVDAPHLTLGGSDDQAHLVGLRFPDVNIAPGSPIADAYIQFSADQVDTGPFEWSIVGQAEDHAEPFADTPYNLSARSRTQHRTLWYGVPVWEPAWEVPGQRDLPQRTPNLAALVQEIVNRPGWRTGGALAFLLEGTGTRTVTSYEGSLAEDAGTAAELVVVLGQRHSYQVAMETDDLEEYVTTGFVDEGSSDLEMCIEQLPNLWTHRLQMIGIRFQGMQIPRGALITDAYIQFACDEPEFFVDPIDLRIAGIAEDNTETFDQDFRSVSSHRSTPTQVVWADIPAWEVAQEAELKQRTPSLAPLVQEIVDRAGWEEDNALGFIVTGSGSRSALSYDGSLEVGRPDLAPMLVVSFMP